MIRQYAEIKDYNSTYIFTELCPFENPENENTNPSITL